MSQRIEIPIPPSANNLWRIVLMRPKGGKGKIRPAQAKTPEYIDWLQTASMLLRAGLERVKALPVRVLVEIHGGQGFPESRDIDNCAKPVVDAIRLSGVLPNDRVTEVSQIDLRYLRAGRANRVATCWVEIEELGESVQGGLFSESEV